MVFIFGRFSDLQKDSNAVFSGFSFPTILWCWVLVLKRQRPAFLPPPRPSSPPHPLLPLTRLLMRCWCTTKRRRCVKITRTARSNQGTASKQCDGRSMVCSTAAKNPGLWALRCAGATGTVAGEPACGCLLARRGASTIAPRIRAASRRPSNEPRGL